MDGRSLIAFVALLLIGLQLQIRSGPGVAGPTRLGGWQQQPARSEHQVTQTGAQQGAATLHGLSWQGFGQ